MQATKKACLVTSIIPIVKPTALGPVANTDTKLLIYGLFQKGRVLAQDGMFRFGWNQRSRGPGIRTCRLGGFPRISRTPQDSSFRLRLFGCDAIPLSDAMTLDATAFVDTRSPTDTSIQMSQATFQHLMAMSTDKRVFGGGRVGQILR